MDRIQTIALSKIADVMADGTLVIPEKDKWKKIFYNAGQSELYDEYQHQLSEVRFEEHWQVYYKNDPRTYSALLEIISILTDDSRGFVVFINEYISKININKVFKDDIEKSLGIRGTRYFDIEEHIRRIGVQKSNELLNELSSYSFKTLKNNLNILDLDISINEESVLKVTPFSLLDKERKQERTGMVKWLEDNYSNILSSYEGAVKMCGEGNPVECLSNCRNVITGIFSYHKDDKTKWVKGLQKACSLDKNIDNIVNPNTIPSFKNNHTHADDTNLRYNYPRFKTVYQIYSFLSDLGPHKDEANLLNGQVDYETPTMKDAIMGLRFTESILIWLYQNQQIEL
jgi:hypothetical protein